MGTGEIRYEKSIWITSTASEDFLEKWLDEGVGFRSCSTIRRLRSSTQEIDTRFFLDCENTDLSVERLEKDKDTDNNVDADRGRMVRPVGSEQSDLSPQRDEIDIDFRVSGLPHAVVKQAENSRVRELVKKIESHPDRQDLQADLQQKKMPTTHLVKSQRRRLKTWAM